MKGKRSAITIFITFVFIAMQGCATIVGDRDQLIGLKSNPDGAQITITDENGIEVFKGTTPTSVTLKKKDGYFDGNDFMVKIQKTGYQDQEVALETNVSGWYIFGNLIFGGLLGYLVVDPLSGAMWTIDPENIDAKLMTVEQAEEGSEKTLNITLLENVPPPLRHNLIKIN